MALVGINLQGGELAYDLIDQLHDQGIRIVALIGYADVPLKQGGRSRPAETRERESAAPEFTPSAAE